MVDESSLAITRDGSEFCRSLFNIIDILYLAYNLT